MCIADDLRIFPPEKLAAGIDLATSSWRRPPSDVLDPRVKSLNYLNNVLAKLEARLCLEKTLKHMPDYEVDLANAVRLRTDFVQGYASLPITF